MAATNERQVLDRLTAAAQEGTVPRPTGEAAVREELLRYRGAIDRLPLPGRIQASAQAVRTWRRLPKGLRGKYVGLLSGLWRNRLQTQQPDKILCVSRLMERLSRKYGSTALRAESLHALGLWHLSHGRFDAAIDQLELSRALFATTRENDLDDARVTVLLSSAHRLAGDHRSAFALLQRARTHCLREEDAILLASVSVNLGLIYIESADLFSAHKAFDFVVESSKVLGSRKRLLRGLLGLVITHTRSGRHESARLTCWDALTLANELQLPRESALAHEYLGELASISGDWRTAIRHFATAARLAIHSKAAPEVRVELHRQLAQMWLAFGDDHYARIHVNKGLSLAGTGAIAEDLLALRRLYLEIALLNGEESALSRLQEHFESSQKTGFGYEALMTAYRTYRIADSLRLDDLAATWWTRAVVFAEAVGAKPLLSSWRAERQTPDTAFVTAAGSMPSLAESSVEGPPKPIEVIGLPAVNLSRHGIVTQCGILSEQGAWIAKIAPTALPVLIRGDSGTGKELFANLVHDLSNRMEGAFYAINCAAMPTELLESELFGHRRGSFTGAISDKTGLFRAAHGGTLFLDEIGEMSLMAQAKLLRVIETGEIRRVGDTESEIVDVRIVAATNVDLEMAVERSKFRRDLYYRLKGLEIHLPPLRERLEDVPHLAKHFVSKACTEMGKTLELTFESTQWLLGQSWPGNVRELRLTMERAVALAPETGVLHPYHFHSGPGARKHLSLASEIEEVERARLLNALEIAGWNKTKAAELLGMRRTTLTGKAKRLGIERPKKH